jgi:hypothetical protein
LPVFEKVQKERSFSSLLFSSLFSSLRFCSSLLFLSLFSILDLDALFQMSISICVSSSSVKARFAPSVTFSDLQKSFPCSIFFFLDEEREKNSVRNDAELHGAIFYNRDRTEIKLFAEESVRVAAPAATASTKKRLERTS